MLGGIDPVLIFQLSKLAPLGPTIAKIPLVSSIPTVVDMPAVPVYLSEGVSGVFVETENKNVDMQTDVETKTDGSPADVKQKGINSSVTVKLLAHKNSTAFTLLSSLVDLIFDKVTSQEYSISYLHGPITVFRGVIQNYAVEQNADNELLTISLVVSKGAKAPAKPPGVPLVPGFLGAVPL